MHTQPPLRLHFAGLVYQFENKEQVYEWVDAQLAYATDRRGFYEALMHDSTHAVMELCSARSLDLEAEANEILKSLKLIADKQGKIYDPRKEIFRLEHDVYEKLRV